MMRKAIPIAAWLCLAAADLPAQLLPEAVAAFPVKTTSLEYDALSKLRLLPNYGSLRKQYSGEGLQRVQKDLSLLGVSEGQLTDVVTASGPNGFFGMLAGNFHAATVAREAARHGIPQSTLEDGPVFCSKQGTCLLLMVNEDGHGFFGTADQLKAISEVRQGRAPSLGTDATFADLNGRMDQQAPVIGFAPGSEIGEWIGGSIPPPISARLDLTRLFSSIQNFGYAVKLDSKAHVELSLNCSSEQAGTLLKDTLSAASGLQRAAAAAGGSAALPFDHMAVQSSGRTVTVNLDAPIQ
jgi:hypothetical protein